MLSCRAHVTAAQAKSHSNPCFQSSEHNSQILHHTQINTQQSRAKQWWLPLPHVAEVSPGAPAQCDLQKHHLPAIAGGHNLPVSLQVPSSVRMQHLAVVAPAPRALLTLTWGEGPWPWCICWAGLTCGSTSVAGAAGTEWLLWQPELCKGEQGCRDRAGMHGDVQGCQDAPVWGGGHVKPRCMCS